MPLAIPDGGRGAPPNTGALATRRPEGLAYTVIGGIPVRNYRAEVTLAPAGDGTHIRWAGSLDATARGRLVWRGLRTLYPQIVEALATAAERQGQQAAAGRR